MLRGGAVALAAALALSGGMPTSLAWASVVEDERTALEQPATSAGDEPATSAGDEPAAPASPGPAAGEVPPVSVEEGPAPEGAKAGEATSLTLSVYEIVFYDDPSFDEPGGLRLMETKVVDGLKAGETVDLWNYVEMRDDFFFFDGWPRYITLSENPEENHAQLHYMRSKSPSVVNYYLVGEASAAPLAKDVPIIGDVAGVPVSFWKMGSYQVQSLPLGAQIASEQCAVDLDGLVYLDADKDSIAVEPLAAANEINLFYTVDTATTLPDDAPVEDAPGADQPGAGTEGDVGAEGGAGDAGAGDAGDSGVEGGTGSGSGSGAEEGAGSPSGDASQEGGASGGPAAGGADEGPSAGNEEAARPDAGGDDTPTVVIEDELSPLAPAREKAAALPQTGDGAGAFAGLLAAAAGAGALALTARGALPRRGR